VTVRTSEQVAIRQAVFDRDRGCRLAGSTLGPCFGPLTFHHLWKASQGGTWSTRNGLTLCAHHNDTIEDMSRDDAEAWGLVIAYGMTHAQAWLRLVVAGIVDYWWDGTPADQSQPEPALVLVRGQ
jgi:hypothetical protein